MEDKDFFATIENIEKRANKYSGINARYGYANALRTCNVLLAYCYLVRVSRAYFFNSLGQYENCISAMELNESKKLTFHKEYEELSFEIEKEFNQTKKNVLEALKIAQTITLVGCDNKSEVETLCVEFSDFIDEIIEDLGLENEQQMED